MQGRDSRPLADSEIAVKLKLSALWASLMFCYIYGDFFGLFVPGSLAEMNRGMMGPLGEATPAVLLGVSAMMAIPSLMVALSLLLPAKISRIANLVFGILFAVIIILTMIPGAQPFYLFFGVIEVAINAGIIWLAWRWR